MKNKQWLKPWNHQSVFHINLILSATHLKNGKDIGEHHPISSGEQKTTLKPPGMIFGYVWLYSQEIPSFGLSHLHFCELNHLNSCFKNGNQPVMILNFLCHIFICVFWYIFILFHISSQILTFFPGFCWWFFRLGTPQALHGAPPPGVPRATALPRPTDFRRRWLRRGRRGLRRPVASGSMVMTMSLDWFKGKF